MNYLDDCTLPNEFLERLAVEGVDALPEMFRILLNPAVQLKRQKHPKASPDRKTSLFL